MSSCKAACVRGGVEGVHELSQVRLGLLLGLQPLEVTADGHIGDRVQGVEVDVVRPRFPDQLLDGLAATIETAADDAKTPLPSDSVPAGISIHWKERSTQA